MKGERKRVEARMMRERNKVVSDGKREKRYKERGK